jgi:hypothetical protein
LEHNHLLEKTALEKRVTSSEQQNELLSKQKAELEQKVKVKKTRFWGLFFFVGFQFFVESASR